LDRPLTTMTDTPPPRDNTIRLVAVASMIGTTIEWYDFFLYGTAAALVFNRRERPGERIEGREEQATRSRAEGAQIAKNTEPFLCLLGI
jgi:hypothetical protein